MRCINCGEEFSVGIFCPKCGTRCEAAADNVTEEMTKEERKDLEQARIRAEEEAEKKREVELAKAKADQEKYEKERIEQEAEFLRQKNENIKLEQEAAAKRAEEEKKASEEAERRAEEARRTFNGQIYATIEEMQSARDLYMKQEAESKQAKKIDAYALWSMILAIATYPLIMTVVLWIPVYIVSIVLSILALKNNTHKKGLAITSVVLNSIFVLIIALALIIGLRG